MKAKRVLSVMLALTGLVSLSPILADDQIHSDWLDTAAEEIVAVHDPVSLLIIGEFHGTKETPALVGIIAQRLAREGPVTFGLEIPRQEQERILEFIRSDGNPADVTKLLAGDFWVRDAERSDGRRSRAMVELLEEIRTAQVQGVPLNVVALDDEDFHAEGSDRHQLLAERIEGLARNRTDDQVISVAQRRTL